MLSTGMPATASVATSESAHVPQRAYVGLTVATAGWASGFVAGKFALAEMTPLAVAAWRYAAATAILFPFALRSRGRSASGRRSLGRIAVPLAVMVIAGGVFYPWLFLSALARTSATNTSLLIALNPLFTLLFVPLLGEPLDRRRLGGAALAFAGAAVVIGHGDLHQLVHLELDTGDFFALAAAVCWAGFNLASRPVVGHIAPSLANFLVYAGGGIGLYLLGRGESPGSQLAGASTVAIGGILAMAILSSVIAGQLFLIGVQQAGVGRAVIFVYLVPVLTALLSAAVLGETVTASQVTGGAAVLLGVYAATRESSA